jgi:hypothetical protein
MKIPGKAIGSIIGIAGALAFSALNTQAQNLLVDGDFENASGIIGWEVYPITPGTPTPSLSDMSASPEYPESGNYALLEQAVPLPPSEADFSVSTAQQMVSGITPGATYTFSIYYLTDSGADLFNGGTVSPVFLEFDFLNSSGSYIASVETTFGDSTGHAPSTGTTSYGATDTGFSYAIPNNNVWYQAGITGTAPVGAAGAFVYAQFWDKGQFTTEDVYFDNASLTSVPEPSNLSLVGIGLAIPFFFIRRKKTNTAS